MNRSPSSLPATDLLHLEPRLAVDGESLFHQLDLAFLGRDSETILEQLLGEAETPRPGWNASLFADDLFIDTLVDTFRDLTLEGRAYRLNTAFLRRVLTQPPEDLGEIGFRHEILRELDADETVRAKTLELYQEIRALFALFKAPGVGAKLDLAAFQLDTLQQVKVVLDKMEEGFADATSGLHRIHEAGQLIRQSDPYQGLQQLLDFEGHLASASLDVRFAVDGRVRSLVLHDVRENRGNRFHRSVPRRVLARLRYWYHGFRYTKSEILSSAIYSVFEAIAPAINGVLQLMLHLEIYLFSRDLRRRAEVAGLRMSLGDFSGSGRVALEELFNPLLLAHGQVAEPCSVRFERRTVTLITGANSGGKTRLLQALGLGQLLGQSGLYVPAHAARMEIVKGLCVSLVEREATDQTEGRLGRELERIRRLFEDMRFGSMVILDELCSGTNPSEGAEVFEMVLQLLPRLQPLAFISTHFLDFARRLEVERPIPELQFLRAQVDTADVPTYQFMAGVADASLAAITARRLGVTFEELSVLVERRLALRVRGLPEPAMAAGDPGSQARSTSRSVSSAAASR